MNSSAPARCRAARRRGLSILEFFGCMTAMVGGALLGSLYLGVDVKALTYTALEKAQIIDPQPTPAAGDNADAATAKPETATPSETPTPPTSTPAPAAPVSETPAPSIETPPPAAESMTPPADLAPPAEEAVASPAPAAGFFTRPELLTDEQRKALTLAYWEALGVCMHDEIENRKPAIDQDGNWQLFDYLTGRKEGHAKAADAILALDANGVDAHVIAYAKKARAWHVDGSKLFGRAVGLLTDAPSAQLSGPFAQSWQSASTQHRMEERLLVEKYQAVETYLSHAYGDAPPAATTE